MYLHRFDQPGRAAAIILPARGSAVESARALPAESIIDGGLVNRVQADPVTFLFQQLSEMHACLGEEHVFLR